MYKIISFYESDRQEHWLEKIASCEWPGGAFLYELLSENTFFETLGKQTRLLLLTDGDELASFCTYAEKDDIQPTDLKPWMGFVYTFPAYRGRYLLGKLFEEIGRLCINDHYDAIYISTNHTGLYEKYGCEYLCKMDDIHGESSRIYVKRFADQKSGTADKNETVWVCDRECRIISLLGHGKGGYSYLVTYEGGYAVLKQIHHEPCDYYSFGNKIEAERNDYERLKNAGIRIPEMIAIDMENERILKEYIEGKTVFDLVKEGVSMDTYLEQVRSMAKQAKDAGLNIDYFPTNFVLHEGLLWYVDYECNRYADEWNFENWGIRYWSQTQEFRDYLRQQECGL